MEVYYDLSCAKVFGGEIEMNKLLITSQRNLSDLCSWNFEVVGHGKQENSDRW